MRILITGGAGFIGSHLTDRLIARGDQVGVIDNLATGRWENLSVVVPSEHRWCFRREGLTSIQGSIADPGMASALFRELHPEVVVHAACSFKNPSDWAEDIRTNILGTAEVIREAERARVRRFVMCQTSLRYGLHPDPRHLDVFGRIKTSHPVQPERTSYAFSKVAGAQYLGLSGLNWVAFCFANICGPRSLSGAIPAFYKRLAAGERCAVADTTRDYVAVSDVVDLLVKAVDGAGRSGRTYHAASGRAVPMLDVMGVIAGVLGIQSVGFDRYPRAEDDAASILLDPSETEHDFGWTTTISYSQAIRRAVEWYKANGVADTYTHLRKDTAR